MLDSLLELEIAYTLVKQEKQEESQEAGEIDTFDRYYLSLKCDIEVCQIFTGCLGIGGIFSDFVLFCFRNL